MIVFLFFRLKRTALCRGTRKLSYGNCKVDWQCLHKARFNKLMLCFLSYECTQHLCLCACCIHRNATHFVHQQQESQSLAAVTCCPMFGQNPATKCFCQLQITILMTLCPINALHFTYMLGFVWASMYFTAVTSIRYWQSPDFMTIYIILTLHSGTSTL